MVSPAAIQALDSKRISGMTTGEFIQFISHAEGSVAELDTQLTLCEQLKLLSPTECQSAASLLDELRRMLNSLRRKLTPAK